MQMSCRGPACAPSVRADAGLQGAAMQLYHKGSLTLEESAITVQGVRELMASSPKQQARNVLADTFVDRLQAAWGSC